MGLFYHVLPEDEKCFTTIGRECLTLRFIDYMSNVNIKFVYDRKKVGSRLKEAPVEVRVTYERRAKYFATGVKVLPHQWKDGVMVRDRLDAEELNRSLMLKMRDVRRVVNDMEGEGMLNLDEIPSRLARLREEGMSFVEFCEHRVAVRRHGLKEDSAERYERFMRFFKEWGGIVWFSDVTDRNVVAMDEELGKRKMTAYSRWHNYHRFLNSFIIDAVEEGRLKRNPYKWVGIVRHQEKRTLDKFLTLEEVNRLKGLVLDGHLERARDLFVFQVYTCLAYVDLAAFDAGRIVDVGGRKMYVGRREKTGQEYSFLMLEPALEVLGKYGGVLPIISNQKYNDYLKVVAMRAGIGKQVSSHFARHTGATLLLNAGVDMEVVAKVLGHSSTRITREVYAKLLDETVADAMEKVEGRI